MVYASAYYHGNDNHTIHTEVTDISVPEYPSSQPDRAHTLKLSFRGIPGIDLIEQQTFKRLHKIFLLYSDLVIIYDGDLCCNGQTTISVYLAAVCMYIY